MTNGTDTTIRAYNGFGQQVKWSNGTTEIQFRYRPDGLRHSKRVETSGTVTITTHYWDRSDIDKETGETYLRARYYDATAGRFTCEDPQRDGNQYSYCGNEPIMNVDPSGTRHVNIDDAGDYVKPVVRVVPRPSAPPPSLAPALPSRPRPSAPAPSLMPTPSLQSGYNVTKPLSNYFGAGSSTVFQWEIIETEIIPDPYPITVKSGSKGSTLISKAGNSTYPISVYSKGRSDNYLLSSAGLKLNIRDFTLDISFGLDDFGITGSTRVDSTTNSFGLKVDLAHFKIGLQSSTTEQVDEFSSITTYTNVSINGWIIIACYVFLKTGQWVSSPKYA